MNLKRIKQIIDRWDPMDLLSHAPKDEYDPEISQIESLLRTGPELSALAEGIEQIFIHAFGADNFRRPRSECLAIARKLDTNAAPVRLLGVYPVPEKKNIYLIELWIDAPPRQVELSQFYSCDPRLKRSDWQVPYDEHYLDSEGTSVLGDFLDRDTVPGDETRLAFFLYTEDRSIPLTTPWGDILLSQTMPLPARLRRIVYEPMD